MFADPLLRESGIVHETCSVVGCCWEDDGSCGCLKKVNLKIDMR